MRDLLAEHAPDELAALKFGTHPLGAKGERVEPDAFVLKAPAKRKVHVRGRS